MLDPVQESSLVSGGDNFDHWHSSDRVPTHATLQRLQQLTRQTTVTGSYTVVDGDDLVLCDTTSTSITVTMPLSKNGRDIHIIKLAAANTMTIQASGTDTISGAASWAATVRWTAFHLKATNSGWLILSRYL